MSSNEHASDSLSRTIAQFALNSACELHVELIKGDECDNISLQVYRRSANGEIIAAAQNIELPIELFDELKRSIGALERALADEPVEVLTSKIEALNPGLESLNQRPVLAKPVKADASHNFAHESEREFARILDFYQIEWYYEPCSFALRWDEQGNVVESFTPDFYLLEHDQYIELTTLKQSLVTKKNRKIRRLRELYPEINIKIMYGRDYMRLLEKYAGSLAKSSAENSKTAPSDH